MCVKRFDVTALGELLVDFTENESGTIEGADRLLFKANPGGAPCNVLAMLCKLSKKTSFIGKVGDDFFGKMLCNLVTAVGINTENLIKSSQYRTTLAFVNNDRNGERSFSFYRNQCADTMITKEEINKEIIASSKIFHFGSLSMTCEPANTATQSAIQIAKENKLIISFDPNLRPMLWETEDKAKEKILFGISVCDILKISDDELKFVTGKDDIKSGVAELKNTCHAKLITVTKGANGSEAFFDDGTTKLHETCPAFTRVKTIDTTGAGDTFCGCVLNDVLNNGFTDFTSERLHKMLVFANVAAALTTTRKGALLSMPEPSAIEALSQIM